MTLYLNHFGLREAPFKITPTTEFFYHGGKRGDILHALLYAVKVGEGIMMVTGEVGSGKTMMLRTMAEKLPPESDLVYIANPSLSGREILFHICEELELKAADDRHDTVRQLQNYLVGRHAEGRRVIAFIDEAQAMPDESLEEIRLLSNLETSREKLLQIILFGQPELDDKLSQQSMRQLRERITVSFKLEPLSRSDVREYIATRLRAAGHESGLLFSDEACSHIYNISQGLSRRVNVLADKAMLSAFERGALAVSAADAKRAAADVKFSKMKYRSERSQRSRAAARRFAFLSAAAAAALLALAVGVRGFQNDEPEYALVPGDSVATAPAVDSVATDPVPEVDEPFPGVDDNNAFPAEESEAPEPETPDPAAIDNMLKDWGSAEESGEESVPADESPPPDLPVADEPQPQPDPATEPEPVVDESGYADATATPDASRNNDNGGSGDNGESESGELSEFSPLAFLRDKWREMMRPQNPPPAEDAESFLSGESRNLSEEVSNPATESESETEPGSESESESLLSGESRNLSEEVSTPETESDSEPGSESESESFLSGESRNLSEEVSTPETESDSVPGSGLGLGFGGCFGIRIPSHSGTDDCHRHRRPPSPDSGRRHDNGRSSSPPGSGRRYSNGRPASPARTVGRHRHRRAARSHRRRRPGSPAAPGRRHRRRRANHRARHRPPRARHRRPRRPRT